MSIETPTVKFEWRVEGEPYLSRVVDGRRLTIDPREVRVVIGRNGLCVYIEGQTIKANGHHGQHRRAHWFDEHPREWSSGAPLAALPDWAEEYLNYVLANHEIRRQER